MIQEVFQAIDTASIQQMSAHAEMLNSVAQTVDQFAQDSISLNNARDWLADKYPGQLALDEGGAGESGGSPRLAVAGEDKQGVLATLSATLQPLTDLSDSEQGTRLVTSARLQMARSRQQLLASMALLGINRMVVTDGAIDARQVFDLKVADQAQRGARASLYDAQSSMNRRWSIVEVRSTQGTAPAIHTLAQSSLTEGDALAVRAEEPELGDCPAK